MYGPEGFPLASTAGAQQPLWHAVAALQRQTKPALKAWHTLGQFAALVQVVRGTQQLADAGHWLESVQLVAQLVLPAWS